MLPLEVEEGKVTVVMSIAKKYTYFTITGKRGNITIRTQDKLTDLTRYIQAHGKRIGDGSDRNTFTLEMDLQTLYDLMLPELIVNPRLVRRIRPFFG